MCGTEVGDGIADNALVDVDRDHVPAWPHDLFHQRGVISGTRANF